MRRARGPLGGAAPLERARGRRNTGAGSGAGGRLHNEIGLRSELFDGSGFPLSSPAAAGGAGRLNGSGARRGERGARGAGYRETPGGRRRPVVAGRQRGGGHSSGPAAVLCLPLPNPTGGGPAARPPPGLPRLGAPFTRTPLLFPERRVLIFFFYYFLKAF